MSQSKDVMQLFVMYLAAFFTISPPTIEAQGSSSSGEYLIRLGEHSLGEPVQY
jgi:neutral ceramidase